ncbi:tyrosine-protein phosphatase non-receptor type substrate 1-like [Rhea pennata]|uniref:tyrosine-protein phosphatase non-receptor type substrate 1-like n=1 Tax=Rhea pennata TaxID=8795 RepID=UPI002E265BBE
MELLSSASGSSVLPLTCLFLISLHGWPGADAQNELQQPQREVTVSVGQTLTLNCTVSEATVVGPVKWLKAEDKVNRTVYEDKGSFSRVTRVVNQSNTDYSIRISNVQIEDAGTYYCVKFQKGEQDKVYMSGQGTNVLVHASPASMAMSGPEHRVAPGSSVRFTCTAAGFFPKDITVKWLKNGAPLTAPQPQVTAGQTNYNMSSTAEVTLEAADIRSWLSCVVEHSTLTAPLVKTYNLSDAVRVSPTVRVLADPPNPVELNKTVNFTCCVEGFYPDVLTLTWLENGTEANVGSPPRPTETSQGTFELQSLLEVQATEEKNQSVFTCQVVHDSQSPASSTVTLQIVLPAADGGPSNQSTANKDNLILIYIAVGVICTVLALLVVAILYLIRAKQSKGKSSPSVRLHEPEKSSGTATQESDPNNLTYADLNFDKEKKSVRRIIEMSQQSEYACIQTNQAPATDDNLTYADLDMVHLSKAPKRPAPRPEEASSEYASVQIQRK